MELLRITIVQILDMRDTILSALGIVVTKQHLI